MSQRVLLRHNKIWTGDPENPWVTALLVDDDTIVAAGEAEQIAADPSLVPDPAALRVVDLPGEVVMPGLHDAHIHPELLVRDQREVDLRECRSLSETLKRIREHAATLPDGEPMLSGRWNHNIWDDPREPHRSDLDAVVGDRLVALDAVHGHAMWVSSSVLRRVGVTRETPDPVGGEIDRDEHGEPTGILRESAMDLLDSLDLPRPDLTELYREGQRTLLAAGLTGITDIDGQASRDAWLALNASGELALRVSTCPREPELDAVIAEGRRAGDGDVWVQAGPVKFFSDGALGSRTAHMTEPYLGHEHCGIAVTPFPRLLERVTTALEAGLDVCTHAIGDEANRLVLDCYRQVRAAGHDDRILRIEHAQHVRTVDLPLFRALEVVASMQPTHCTTDLEVVDEAIGRRRLASYAWRSMLDAGVHVAFGSDAPVEDHNPFLALHAAVTRMRVDGFPPGGWQPYERVSLDEAVRAHTSAAYAAVGRHDVGSLVPGQLADLICLDRDIWALEQSNATQIAATEVLQTWTGGRLRHERG